jgi:hypothetical protein
MVMSLMIVMGQAVILYKLNFPGMGTLTLLVDVSIGGSSIYVSTVNKCHYYINSCQLHNFPS